ncbi:MAG: DNA polymerase III subunit gamma/tau [Candidatus Delongbacteria bacterium]|nr:DNA polymerase III subunit gamma/tau [Candidatus Delongbacteria bacterium]MDD4205306.1 DNA polymerase III subunit gamma/tau [Candidatus Delongbacteria bacterium]
MSYLVIARKYRPLTFEDVIGQEHVTTTLMNAIKNNKVHHAYLLTGPRGVGKTTISRILAKCLNCETGVTPTPCGVCSNCVEIDQGNSLDVKEIDGASNRGIDEIRDLRDDIKFSPAKSRKKIYIIDEVHMLTNQAFNALLKTLEEPPEHAVFIFATTEVNEVPATILSRCQRHDFKRVDIDVLSKALKEICGKEGVEIDDGSLIMLSKAGDGSVRDSQSALDQVIAFCGNIITADKTAEALGITPVESFFRFTDIVLSKDTGELITYIDELFGKGLHILAYIKGLMEFFRDLLILKTVNDAKILDMSADNLIKLGRYKQNFGEKDLLLFIDILSQSVQKLKSSPFQRMDFEIILLKILHHEPVSNIEEIIKKLSAVEGDLEIDTDQIIGEITSRLKTAQVNIIQQQLPEPDKKKTPETDLNLDKFVSKWEDFISHIKNANSRLSVLEFGVPAAMENNRVLKIKFDKKDSVFKNLCDSKKEEIEKELNSFFETGDVRVIFDEGTIKKTERIIKISQNVKKSQDEKKTELLNKAPQLKFLFEKPFNCKFID